MSRLYSCSNNLSLLRGETFEKSWKEIVYFVLFQVSGLSIVCSKNEKKPLGIGSTNDCCQLYLRVLFYTVFEKSILDTSLCSVPFFVDIVHLLFIFDMFIDFLLSSSLASFVSSYSYKSGSSSMPVHCIKNQDLHRNNSLLTPSTPVL